MGWSTFNCELIYFKGPIGCLKPECTDITQDILFLIRSALYRSATYDVRHNSEISYFLFKGRHITSIFSEAVSVQFRIRDVNHAISKELMNLVLHLQALILWIFLFE